MKVLLEFILGSIGSFLEIIYRHFRERPELKIKVSECNWANIPENGSQVSFILNVDNEGDRGTSITQVRLVKFDRKDVNLEAEEWTQTEKMAYRKPLPFKHVPANASIKLEGLFSFGKHLSMKDYHLVMKILHTHGTEKIEATAESGFI